MNAAAVLKTSAGVSGNENDKIIATAVACDQISLRVFVTGLSVRSGGSFASAQPHK